MKTSASYQWPSMLPWVVAAIATLVVLIGAVARATESNAPAAPAERERIGIYDSRIVAYAHFWGGPHQRLLNERIAAAKAAKARGDVARFKELDTWLRDSQRRVHFQVFSTAPIDDVLADMQARVAAVQKEARVSRLVSKWDEDTLRACGEAEKVDVTSLLLQDFTLNEKQNRVIQEMRQKDPVPLAEAQALDKAGKL